MIDIAVFGPRESHPRIGIDMSLNDAEVLAYAEPLAILLLSLLILLLLLLFYFFLFFWLFLVVVCCHRRCCCGCSRRRWWVDGVRVAEHDEWNYPKEFL